MAGALEDADKRAQQLKEELDKKKMEQDQKLAEQKRKAHEDNQDSWI